MLVSGTGDRVYLSQGDVVDISDPTNPHAIGTVPFCSPLVKKWDVACGRHITSLNCIRLAIYMVSTLESTTPPIRQLSSPSP